MSKKILYWGPYSGHVGTIKAQINSAYSMVKYGKHRVALVRVHSEFQGYESDLEKMGIRLLDLGLSRFFPGLEKSERFARRPYMLVAAIFGFIPFMLALKREKPDMVIMNLVVLPVLLACVLSRQKMIKVVSVQGYPQFLGVRGAVVPIWKRAENRLRKFLWALVYPRAVYILTMTEGTRTKLLENTSLDSSQVRVVNNAVVDDKVLSGRSSPVPHEWYCKDVPLVVGVGRLTRQKGFDVLVDAMYKLHQLGLEARLIIVGEGEERDSLQNQIDRTGQAEKIKLVGHQNNPYPFIAHADLFVLSSRWEDPGHAIIEAAALRVPIVTTDCPSGPSDLVGNGEGGWICENANADDMADKIKLALENPDDGMLAVSAENADQYTLESHFRALELLF